MTKFDLLLNSKDNVFTAVAVHPLFERLNVAICVSGNLFRDYATAAVGRSKLYISVLNGDVD